MAPSPLREACIMSVTCLMSHAQYKLQEKAVVPDFICQTHFSLAKRIDTLPVSMCTALGRCWVVYTAYD